MGDMQEGNTNERSGLGGHCGEIEPNSLKIHAPAASLCHVESRPNVAKPAASSRKAGNWLFICE